MKSKRTKGRRPPFKKSNDRTDAPILATGTISIHPKGFGFVKSLASSSDVFIPKQRMNDAVDGDEVEIEIDPNPTPKGPEGTVLAILKRSRSSLAGTVIGKSKNH